MIPVTLSTVWEVIVGFWGWILGTWASVATVSGGWLLWRRRHQSDRPNTKTTDLSVVRDIGGPAAKDLGMAISDYIKAWRLNNLINISMKFERIREEKKLTRNDIRHLSMSVGIPMLEHASNEDDDELQELWANLMVSATRDSNSDEESRDAHKVWTYTLAMMSKSDCILLGTVVENGMAGQNDGAIYSNPLTQDQVREAADMPRVTVNIHLEHLVSLGLVYRDLRTPMQSGGPMGFEYSYAPTLLGINLYAVCGNTPSWMGKDYSPTEDSR